MNRAAETRDFAAVPACTFDNILDSARPKPFAFLPSGQDPPNPSNTIDGCEAFPEQEVYAPEEVRRQAGSRDA